MKTIHQITYPCIERGAALVVSMMMLIAITLVGMAAMGNSRLEWLMASNTNFQTSALVRAERTLADTAENQLVNLVCGSSSNCDARTFNWDIRPDAFFNNVFGTDPLLVDPGVVSTWNNLPSNNAVDNSGTVIGRYIIVYRGCVTGSGSICAQPPTAPFTDTYEVWALSTDEKGTARIVRSTFITTNPATGAPPPWRRIGYSEINS